MRVLPLLLIAACAGPSAQTARWPAHRQRHDAELERLGRDVDRLETKIVGLEARLRQLEHPASPP